MLSQPLQQRSVLPEDVRLSVFEVDTREGCCSSLAVGQNQGDVRVVAVVVLCVCVRGGGGGGGGGCRA